MSSSEGTGGRQSPVNVTIPAGFVLDAPRVQATRGKQKSEFPGLSEALLLSMRAGAGAYTFTGSKNRVTTFENHVKDWCKENGCRHVFGPKTVNPDDTVTRQAWAVLADDISEDQRKRIEEERPALLEALAALAS